jgi:hypothetical protein
MSTNEPPYFSNHENFALDRSPSGVLTARFTPTADQRGL